MSGGKIWQPRLDDKYTKMPGPELEAAIADRKAKLGKSLVILGHHYQRDEVIAFADFTGDSFKLAQLAAQQVTKNNAKYVVFCGVHFMAESADILTPDDVTVILPDLAAGCSMADMADLDQATEALQDIQEVLEDNGQLESTRIIPICYMNSSAEIKAFCGEHGGAVCTSSNSGKLFRWALAGGDEPLEPGQTVKILFMPDQHLGTNTAANCGFDTETDMSIWDAKAPQGMGGLDPEDILRSTFLLWKGHCSVHMLFRPEHVDLSRSEQPNIKIMVHPECCHDVVLKSDYLGSTAKIIDTVMNSKPGSYWALGTEVHLVARLAKEAAKKDIHVKMLSGCQCLCTTMFRIDRQHLLWTLDELLEGRVHNQVKVPERTRKWSLVALQRMLDVTADPKWDAKPIAALSATN